MAARKKKVSWQEKMKKIEEAVSYFESDEFDLEEGVKRYEEAVDLLEEVMKGLQSYELRVKKKQQVLDNLGN